MGAPTRKKHELRKREELFLQVARRLLLERGFHGLTMDRIAEETGYSKGTIYLHFGCKEELLLELGKRSRRERLDFITRSVTFKGRPWRCGAFGRSPDRHTRVSRQAGSISVRVIGATPTFPRPVPPTISARRTTLHRGPRRNSPIPAAGRRQARRDPRRRAWPNCSGRSCPRGSRGRSRPLRGHGPGRRRSKSTAGANRFMDNFPDSC